MNITKLTKHFICFLLLLTGILPAKAQIFRINTINCKLSNADTALLNKMGRFEANFYNQVFKTTRNDTVTIDINLYGKKREFNDLQNGATANATFADGYYMPAKNKIFIYKTDNYMRTLFHESSHNLLRYNYTNPPKWLNEGIATLLGYLVETTDNRILYMPQAGIVKMVKDSIRARTFNLNNFFKTPNSDWYIKKKADMLYATSYCIIYFLINQDKDYLAPILVLMQKGYSTDRAIKEAFGSLNNFAEEFYDFYLRGAGIKI
ncbi:MAG: hypothetical protein ABIN91_18850 [Mucilaginibacter sp.]|uniref:hypothetical protein n=1 Tax=Mucilaginibacter sp. TaxID=1882438 RepID=UPI0032632669